MESLSKRRYNASNWLILLAGFQVPLMAFFLAIPFRFPDTSGIELALFWGIGAVFGTMMIYLIFLYKTSHVEISDHRLHLRYGFKKKSINLKSVFQIYLQAGHIVLDEGRVPKFTIPMIFESKKMLLNEVSENIKSIKG